MTGVTRRVVSPSRGVSQWLKSPFLLLAGVQPGAWPPSRQPRCCWLWRHSLPPPRACPLRPALRRRCYLEHRCGEEVLVGEGLGGAFCPRWPTLRRRCYLGHRCVRWGEGLCWGLLPDPARFASPLLPRAQAGGSMCVPQGASVGNVLKIQASSWMVGSSASLIQELLSRIVPPKTCLPPFTHPTHSGPTAGVVR